MCGMVGKANPSESELIIKIIDNLGKILDRLNYFWHSDKSLFLFPNGIRNCKTAGPAGAGSSWMFFDK